MASLRSLALHPAALRSQASPSARLDRRAGSPTHGRSTRITECDVGARPGRPRRHVQRSCLPTLPWSPPPPQRAVRTSRRRHRPRGGELAASSARSDAAARRGVLARLRGSSSKATPTPPAMQPTTRVSPGSVRAILGSPRHRAGSDRRGGIRRGRRGSVRPPARPPRRALRDPTVGTREKRVLSTTWIERRGPHVAPDHRPDRARADCGGL